tara:strand:+ start:1401 stop:1952 length:552 start_codon:yes stop_codon:yes gene_type:complete
MQKLIRYIICVITIAALIFLLKPIYFYVKVLIIQKQLYTQWDQSIKQGEIKTENKIYPIGKIKINSSNINSIILSGDIEKSLNYGIAHIPNTKKPGNKGNVVLAAHRDTFFRNLKDIKLNDIIEIKHLNGKDIFRVFDIKVIQPYETNYLYNSENCDLTLITCYPFEYFGNSPLRYIVRAKLS